MKDETFKFPLGGECFPNTRDEPGTTPGHSDRVGKHGEKYFLRFKLLLRTGASKSLR